MHPEDDRKCIKVPLKTRPSGLDPNLRELAEYERLLSVGAPVQRFFAQVYGLVETDLGPGLCVERLRGITGEEPVPTVVSAILRRLQGELPLAPILKGLDELVEFCIEYQILGSCQELKNIGVVGRNGTEAVVGYDVKEIPNKEFIPISTYFSFFRRKKIARRSQRMLRELDGVIENATRRGDYGERV